MKATLRTALGIASIVCSVSASANVGGDFAQDQAVAIQTQEKLIRTGVAEGTISKELCVFFVQSLSDMKRNAYTVGIAVGGNGAELSSLSQLKTMTTNECK